MFSHPFRGSKKQEHEDVEADQIHEKIKMAQNYENRDKNLPVGAKGASLDPREAPTGADAEDGFGSIDPLEASRLRVENLWISVEKDKLEDAAQNRRLRQHVAYWSLAFVGAQLAVSDYLFLTYLRESRNHIGDQVIIAWLSVSVVEIIGILWVVARNLFPFQDVNRIPNLETERPRAIPSTTKRDDIDANA